MSEQKKKTILEKLDALSEKVANDVAYGNTISWMAATAILEGFAKRGEPPKSGWEDFMKEIVGPGGKKQLRRLTLDDGYGGLEDVKKSCAYILGNAVCGWETKARTRRRVHEDIDKDLDPEPYTG